MAIDKTYDPTNWVDGETIVNAEHLDNIESGVFTNRAFGNMLAVHERHSMTPHNTIVTAWQEIPRFENSHDSIELVYQFPAGEHRVDTNYTVDVDWSSVHPDWYPQPGDNTYLTVFFRNKGTDSFRFRLIHPDQEGISSAMRIYCRIRLVIRGGLAKDTFVDNSGWVS